MHSLSFSPPSLQKTALQSYYWRLALALLLLCQSLWITTQPTVAATHRQEQDVTLDTPFEIVIGEEIAVTVPGDKLLIWFAHVLRDNRCPDGETCAKAGRAEFQLFVSHGDREDNEMFTLDTTEEGRKFQYQGYEIELLEVLTPAPKADENFILLEYHLQLLVHIAEAEAEPTPGLPTQQDDNNQSAPTGLEPLIVDGCRNFSPYDAAAILQEDVNASEPIGNIFFGPLPEAGATEGFNGLCGYTNTTHTSVERDTSQTHIATELAYDHLVVAEHLSAEILNSATTGNMVTDWFELMLLAEVVGAASGEPAGSAFEVLYAAANIGDYTAMLEVLETLASQSDSFTVTNITLDKNDPRDEMLWLWQTLDHGYFSLLISRQGSTFDLVAALLGTHVKEKIVLGYSRVLLNQVADGSAAHGCDYLTLDEVEAIVGEAVETQAVANEQGAGCKYTPIKDEVNIDFADFTHLFPYNGLLAGIIPPRAAQRNLSNWVTQLSTTGQVRDGETLSAILAAIEDEELSNALTMMGELSWDSYQWQVETLSAVSSDTLLIYDIARTGRAPFFVLSNRPNGGLYYLAGVQEQEIDEVRDAFSTAIQALAQERGTEQPPVAPTSEQQPKEETVAETPAAPSGCTLLTLAEAEAIVGEPLEEHVVVGERGDGCKYTPEAEKATIEPDDFSPNFESSGLLAGLMPQESAQWLLSQFVEEVLGADSEIDQATVAKLNGAIEAGEIKSALQQLATLESSSSEWQSEALIEVSDDTVWIHGEMPGTLVSFFFRSQADGGMWSIAVQLPEDGDVEAMRDAVIEVLIKLPE